MIELSINHATGEIERHLTRLQREQLPFASALALTRTAYDVRDAQRDRRASVFDRPRLWTVRAGARIERATPDVLEARVTYPLDGARGRAAMTYLRPQMDGGRRMHKGFERALIARGIMRANEYAVPGDMVRLDRYGNPPRSLIVRMLSQLRAFREQGSQADATGSRRSRASRARQRFFVPGQEVFGRVLPRGVYVEEGRGDIFPVFVFVRTAPSYRAVYDHRLIAETVIDQVWDDQFARALDQALRTAR